MKSQDFLWDFFLANFLAQHRFRNKIKLVKNIIRIINPMDTMQSMHKWQHPNLLLSIKSSHPTINSASSRYPVINQVASKLGMVICQDSYNLLWTDQPLPVRDIKMLDNEIKVNHFAEITCITRKNKLAALLNTLRLHFPKDYLFYPQTWLLPYDFGRMTKKHIKNKVYIVKPQNGCQGQGIYLTNNPFKLQQEKNIIVQEYVPNPMLLNGLKFDLRIYVLITCVQPLRIFVYKDGIVRFATEKFEKASESNLANQFAHLTNYAINKQHHSFNIDSQNQEGHKRLITSVFKNEEYTNLMAEVNKIIVKTVIAGLPIIQNGHSQCKKVDPSSCFQLLGFDILMTNKKEPILLEVNQNPSLNTQTEFDNKLKTGLVKNILEMMTGGYRCSSEDKYEMRVKLKDRHEHATRGQFKKIYPCENFEETEMYDHFMIKSANLFREKFGINVLRGVKKSKEVLKEHEMSTAWNEQPSHYTHSKIEKVYGASNVSFTNPLRTKTSTHKKRLIFL